MKLVPPPIRERNRVRRIRTRTSELPPPCDPAAKTYSTPELHHLDVTKHRLEPTEIALLRSPNRRLRSLDNERIKGLADRMREHETPLPIYAFQDGEIAYGHDIVEAYRLMGSAIVPVIRLTDRGPGERASARIYLDRAHSEGELDPAVLKTELETVCEFAPNWLAATHRTSVEIDFALNGDLGTGNAPPDLQPFAPAGPVVTKTGRLWTWSFGHRLACGSSLDALVIAQLMNGELAHLFAADVPYGTSVANISSSHPEWKQGSGMSEAEAEVFHKGYWTTCLPAVRPGALAYAFIDGKGMYALLASTRAVGLTQKYMCTWDKKAPGQGGMYRSQSEHIYVGQYGKLPPGVKPPKRRRGRTTIWQAPGYATFRPDRKQALKDHACTKPQSILMDLLQDASQIGDIVLDPFGGSGSMMIAAQRTKRRCYSVEIEERFCDIAIQRMYELTGEYPVDEVSGLTFEQLAAEAGVTLPAAPVADDENA